MPDRLAIGSGKSTSTAIEVSKFVVSNYGDATPTVIWQMPFNRRIVRITIETKIVWNGAGASVILGTASIPDKYFQVTDLDLTSLEYFDKEFSEAGPIDFQLTIVPGIAATSGQINIIFETISI